MAKKLDYNELVKNSAIMNYIDAELNTHKEILKIDRTLQYTTISFVISVLTVLIVLFMSVK